MLEKMKKLILLLCCFSLSGCSTKEFIYKFLPPPIVEPVGKDPKELNIIYQGYATWYQTGHFTASGQRFHPDKFTLAHRTLPFGTELKLTNPENGNSIKAVVNDRGPRAKNRHYDVSRGVAKALGFKKKGVAKLHIQIIRQP
jgi:rare lipoprotein A